MESTDVINEIRGILPRNSIGKYDLLTIFTHKTVFDKIVKVLNDNKKSCKGKCTHYVRPCCFFYCHF